MTDQSAPTHRQNGSGSTSSKADSLPRRFSGRSMNGVNPFATAHMSKASDDLQLTDADSLTSPPQSPPVTFHIGSDDESASNISEHAVVSPVIPAKSISPAAVQPLTHTANVSANGHAITTQSQQHDSSQLQSESQVTSPIPNGVHSTSNNTSAAAAHAQYYNTSPTKVLKPADSSQAHSTPLKTDDTDLIDANEPDATHLSASTTAASSIPTSSSTSYTHQQQPSTNGARVINVAPKSATNDIVQQQMQITRWGEIRPLEPSRAKLTPEQRQRQQQQLLVDHDREKKWLAMLHNWPAIQNSDKVKTRVRKGIPDSLRGTVWPKLCHADELAAQQQTRQLYQSLQSQQSDMQDVITRDIHRTFPLHVFFKQHEEQEYDANSSSSSGVTIDASGIQTRGRQGRSSLFNVLKAYSIHDRQLGYCQGLGFIAGMYLTYMSEVEAFCMLKRLMRGDDRYMIAGLYSPGFPLLNQYFYIFDQLIAQRHSRLHAHLKDLCIEPPFYATQWFITCYSYNFPFEVVLRIMDILLHSGTKILFRVALYIVSRLEPQLLKGDMESAIQLLKEVHKHPMMSDVDAFIRGVCEINITTSQIQKLAQQYGNQQLATQNKR